MFPFKEKFLNFLQFYVTRDQYSTLNDDLHNYELAIIWPTTFEKNSAMEQSQLKLSFDLEDILDLNRPFSSDEFKSVLQLVESKSIDSANETASVEISSISDETPLQNQLFRQINCGK